MDARPTKERWTREGRRSRFRPAANEVTEAQLSSIGEGRVVERHRRSCTVQLADRRELECRYGSSLPGNDGTGVAVGDWVRYGHEPQSNLYYLTELLPRRTKLSRPGPPGREHREQLLAANIDQLVVVATVASPPFRPGFIDRYLLMAEWSDLPMLLVINKIDLAEKLPGEVAQFEGLVEKIIPISAVDGRGMEQLLQALQGKSSVLTGHSGVGKSTIVQRLIPGVELETGEVRSDGKGRHTTISSTLHHLPGGGDVIDTPGIRGLGLWKADPDLLPRLFSPFRPYAGQCRFADCRHLDEPGCAVENAFQQGELQERFRQSYRHILEELQREAEHGE